MSITVRFCTPAVFNSGLNGKAPPESGGVSQNSGFFLELGVYKSIEMCNRTVVYGIRGL